LCLDSTSKPRLKRARSTACIPRDLAGLVLSRLPALVDRVRFVAVCSQWRAAARELPPTMPPLPLLMLPDGTAYSFPCCKPLCFPACAGYAGACGNWLLLDSPVRAGRGQQTVRSAPGPTAVGRDGSAAPSSMQKLVRSRPPRPAVQLLSRPCLHRACLGPAPPLAVGLASHLAPVQLLPSPLVPIELAAGPAAHLTIGPAPLCRRSPSSSPRSSPSRHRRSSSSPHRWSSSSSSPVLQPHPTVHAEPPSTRRQEERVGRI
jgi:hypothetical protein